MATACICRSIIVKASDARVRVSRRIGVTSTFSSPSRAARRSAWMPLDECRQAAGAFDPPKDLQLFSDSPRAWVAGPPGHFTIFFPEDAHAPLGGRGRLKKAIVKVASTEVLR